MSQWKSVLTLTVAAAMIATSAFAQSGAGSGNSATKTPSASPSKSDADTSSGSTPSASPSPTPTDPSMKSDTMKSDTMSRSRGMSGGNREQVKAAQQTLKDKGHDPGAVDGVMGPKTRSALKDFQKKEGIKDTGRLDQDTMSKLGVEARTSGTGSAPGSASPSMSTPGAATPGAGASHSATTDKKSGSAPTEKK